MRRLMIAMIVAGALVPVAAAADTVEGELVTAMCVAKNGEKGQGAAHVDCAIDCAKKGYPLAVLTAGGVMYKITGSLTSDNNAKLQPLLATKVVATGHIAEPSDGSEKTIDADSIVPAAQAPAPSLPYTAVHDPEFTSAAAATFMNDDDRVIGLMTGSIAKAYPAGILSQHGLVEDRSAKGPIAVTW